MSSSKDFDFDEIGYWLEIKLEIIRKYAQAYSTILSKRHLEHVYVDAFAGAGIHLARSTGQFVSGSPLNALLIDPPFKEFFLIDMDAGKASHLQQLTGNRQNVHVYEGDCNEVLLEQVFPKIRYEDYRRGLCGIDWVIVGGESGPRARPMEIAWVRDIRDQCLNQGVAFFFKQWGGVFKKRGGRQLEGRTWDQMPVISSGAQKFGAKRMTD
jgi:Protein of unknown function (DUF5131)